MCDLYSDVLVGSLWWMGGYIKQRNSSTKGKKMDCVTLQQPVAEVRVNLQDFNH